MSKINPNEVYEGTTTGTLADGGSLTSETTARVAADAAIIAETLQPTTAITPTGGGTAISIADNFSNQQSTVPDLQQTRATIATLTAAATSVNTFLTPASTYPAGTLNTSIGIGNFNPYDGQSANQFNTAVGVGAMSKKPNQNSNVAIGALTLAQLVTGTGYNGGQTVVGALAGCNLISGPFNTLIGNGSGQSLTTGFANTSLGHGSMTGQDAVKLPCIGSYNTALGNWTLQGLVNGNFNTTVGAGAGTYLTTGSSNVLVGTQIGGQNPLNNSSPGSLPVLLTGSSNVAVGASAMQLVGGAVSNNTAIGSQALYSDQSGSQVGVGYFALKGNTTGTANTAVGLSALTLNTTGSSNVAIGSESLASSTTGGNNVAVGANSLVYATTGLNNTALGWNAGFGPSGGNAATLSDSGATFIGAGASRDNSIPNTTALSKLTVIGVTATGNTSNAVFLGNSGVTSFVIGGIAGKLGSLTTGVVSLGMGALPSTSTGTLNTGVGVSALAANTTASGNTALGNGALYSATSGSQNTGLGNNAGIFNTTGYNNVFVGWDSGFGASGTQQSTVDTNVVYIGAGASRDASVAFSTPINNAIAIGASASVATSNTAVIGSSALTNMIMGGDTTGPQISWGTVTPTVAPASGAGLYFKIGGATGSSLYNYSAAAWHAIA